MTHEQMMEKAWRIIHEVGITEDKEEAAADESLYLVENIYHVRDAIYGDLENGVDLEEAEKFFARHGIKWE